MRYILLLSVIVSLPAYADDNKPERMTLTEAAQLDAAMAHEQLIMQQAQIAAQQFEMTIAAICKAHKIDRAELGKSVGVDVTTGEIQRAPKPAPKK